MRDYYVVWQGERFIDLFVSHVPAVVYADHDPGPTTLGGASVPFVKKYIRLPKYREMLTFLNTVDVFHHPADPLVISYGSVLLDVTGGAKDTKEELMTPDAIGYTKGHHPQGRFY
jgi:hypothetical protein